MLTYLISDMQRLTELRVALARLLLSPGLFMIYYEVQKFESPCDKIKPPSPRLAFIDRKV